MISSFARAYCAQEGLSEDTLRFLHAWAKENKDTPMLVGLARRGDLPADVCEAYSSETAAVVVTARLTREGVSAAELARAAKDKRVSIQQAIASAEGLPADVYRTVSAAAKSLTVRVALVANTSIPQDVRMEQVRELESPMARGGELNWGQSTAYKTALLQLVLVDPQSISGIELSYSSRNMLTHAEQCPSELYVTLVEEELAFLEAFDWSSIADKPGNRFNGDAYRMSTRFHLVSDACQYTDIDDATVERVRKLAVTVDNNCRGGFSPSAVRSLTSSLQRRKPRAVKGASLPIEHVIASSDEFTLRLSMVEADQLTDDEYARVVREGTRSLTAYEGWGHTEAVTVAREHLAEYSSSADRSAALLSRMIADPQDIHSLSCDRSELIEALVGYHDADMAAAGSAGAYPWVAAGIHNYLVHALHSLPDQIGQMPSALLDWMDSQASPSCCSTGHKQMQALTMSHLFERMGHDVNSWRAFDTIAGKLPASLDQAADTALASTGS